MAEEKKTPEKQGWFKKLINWFKNLPGRIAKAFKNMVAELRKVTWPSKKKLISSCITVLLFMLVTGAIVGLLDVTSAAAVNGLYRLGNGDPMDQLIIDEGALTDDLLVTDETVTDETVTDETVTDETVTDETVTTDDAAVTDDAAAETNEETATPAE